MATKADRYEGIDGLKAYAIIGIALMHVLSNGKYEIGGYIFTAVAVICGSVVFSVCAKWFLNKIETFLKERVNNRRANHV